MRIGVIGAGPAGLYFAALWKSRHRSDEIIVMEQNPAGATFGFGVVFSDSALDFLREDDAATYALIAPHMEHWRDITLSLRGEPIVIDGVGFSAIGRLELLTLLCRRAEDEGATLAFDHKVDGLHDLRDFDLVIAADGANSIIRQTFAEQFATRTDLLSNRFAWFGTTTSFDTLTQTFVDSEWGPFNAHHYRYGCSMSTFIVECGEETWQRAGFDSLSEDEARERCGRIFHDALQGAPLIGNRSIWRQFPFISCGRWSHDNIALVGDALHTAHFSIGSGTRLALEDVIALVKALEAETDTASAFAHYEMERKPVLDKLVAASRRSAEWYENFDAHMNLAPAEFAMNYLTRSGRIEPDRLETQSPRFAAWYRSRDGSLSPSGSS